MTTTLVLKYFRNNIGIAAISCPHSGYTIKNFILQYIIVAQVFSCEFCEISKNTFFTEHIRAAVSNIRSTHFKNIKEPVDFDTSNLCARSCIPTFKLNRINVNTSC